MFLRHSLLRPLIRGVCVAQALAWSQSTVSPDALPVCGVPAVFFFSFLLVITERKSGQPADDAYRPLYLFFC